MRSHFSKSRSQVSKLRSQVSKLRSQVSKLRSQVSMLRSQVSKLRSQVSKLRLQVSKLRSQVSKLRSQVNNLRSQVSKLLRKNRCVPYEPPYRSLNDLSTAVQLTNRLLRFWADKGFVYYKRVSIPSFLVSSQSLIVIITSWFGIALDEVRTRRILREKAECKQSREHNP